MRYYLFIFISSFTISILCSCVNTNTTAKEPSATAPKALPVYALQAAALLPGGSLYTPITEGARDTILSKIQKYETRQKDKSVAVSTKSLRNIRYFPVIEAFKDSTDHVQHYRASKGVVCLNETSHIYYGAEYQDRSNFKKEDNLNMYNGIKEVHGQKFADETVRRYKAIKWTVGKYFKDGKMSNKMDYAIQESDDGSFFMLKSTTLYGGSNDICYFKDGKPYICKEGKDGTIIGKELQ